MTLSPSVSLPRERKLAYHPPSQKSVLKCIQRDRINDVVHALGRSEGDRSVRLRVNNLPREPCSALVQVPAESGCDHDIDSSRKCKAKRE